MNGTLNSPPGPTLRWNYAITNNDPTYWLVLTSMGVNIFQYGTSNDNIFDYPIIAPAGQSSSRLYAFTWDSSAPAGLINNGYFTLSAEL